MTSITRRNHYVAQHYQTKFYPPDAESFWVYDRQRTEAEPHKATEVATCVQRDLYSIKMPDGSTNDELERIFADIESAVNPIIDRMAGTQDNISEQDKEMLASYFSYQHARVPRNIDAMKQFEKEFCISNIRQIATNPVGLRNLFDKYYSEKSITLEQFTDRVLNPEKYYQFIPNEKVALMDSLNLVPTIFNHLLQLNWTVITAPDGAFFVTCDTPLVVFAQKPDGMTLFGAGFGLHNIEIHFPLSHKKCIYMSHSQISSKLCCRPLISELNRRTMYIAYRWIISPFRSNKIKKFIHEMSDRPLGARIRPFMGT